ncbi:MAG TPA: hypothetical protein VF708_18510 [Pyrinomonadaceae bacterium]
MRQNQRANVSDDFATWSGRCNAMRADFVTTRTHFTSPRLHRGTALNDRAAPHNPCVTSARPPYKPAPPPCKLAQ